MFCLFVCLFEKKKRWHPHYIRTGSSAIKAEPRCVLGENDLHRLMYLIGWAPVWEGFRGVASLEDMCHKGEL